MHCAIAVEVGRVCICAMSNDESRLIGKVLNDTLFCRLTVSASPVHSKYDTIMRHKNYRTNKYLHDK